LTTTPSLYIQKLLGGKNKKMMWMTYRCKELQTDDLEGIRQFAMVNKGSEEIAVALKELTQDIYNVSTSLEPTE
jgi:hypothetical protein